eukprot:3590602-Rhodomonas_salina.5
MAGRPGLVPGWRVSAVRRALSLRARALGRSIPCVGTPMQHQCRPPPGGLVPWECGAAAVLLSIQPPPLPNPQS